MPSIENHVKFCVRDFGEENRELCYMVNSWIDAPSRELGRTHRKKRHDFWEAPILACAMYGDGFYVEAEGVTDIICLDAKDVRQINSISDLLLKTKGQDTPEGNIILVDAENMDTICMYRVDGNFDLEMFDIDGIYIILEEGIKYIPPTPKNLLIARMVLQHLMLDGLITPEDVRNWTWQKHKKKLGEKLRKLEKTVSPLRKGRWKVIASFEGNTSQITELFSVSRRRWRVKWQYEPCSYLPHTKEAAAAFAANPFSVNLCKEDGKELYKYSIRGRPFSPSGGGIMYIYEGPGNFYFDVQALGVKWKLVVEVHIPRSRVLG